MIIGNRKSLEQMRIPRHCLERHKNLRNLKVKMEMIHSRNRRLKTKEIYFLHLTSQVSIISLRNVMEINIALSRAHGSVSILGYTMMKKRLFCYICSNQYLNGNLASAKNTEQAFISIGFLNPMACLLLEEERSSTSGIHFSSKSDLLIRVVFGLHYP